MPNLLAIRTARLFALGAAADDLLWRQRPFRGRSLARPGAPQRRQCQCSVLHSRRSGFQIRLLRLRFWYRRRVQAPPRFARYLARLPLKRILRCDCPTTGMDACFTSAVQGFDGTIPNLDPHSSRLQQGYALTASNGGHRDPTRGPARFAQRSNDHPGLCAYRHRQDRQFREDDCSRLLRSVTTTLVLLGLLGGWSWGL